MRLQQLIRRSNEATPTDIPVCLDMFNNWCIRSHVLLERFDERLGTTKSCLSQVVLLNKAIEMYVC